MNELRDFLVGRIWLRSHLPFPKEVVDAAIEQGRVEVVKGITDRGECCRCLETSQDKIVSFYCSKCSKVCRYCRNCIQMGRVSSCSELVLWSDSPPPPQSIHSFAWKGELTVSQQTASSAIIRSLSLRQSHLVYAVCGAGKTELLFPVIFDELQRGHRICIAAPRVDVILELAPRIQSAFPETLLHVLYGDSPQETGFATIVLATTHQLFRFQSAFDVLIVDEADAFPYSMDLSLERAVGKSIKGDSPIVYVTATPSRKLLRKTPNRSEIFQRFHGHPLPVPQFASLWNYEKALLKNRLPEKLKAWTKSKLEKKEPFLIFLPTIELISLAIPLFKELHPGIEAVHASDDNRKEKIMALRNKEVPGVLTSTILERGITIQNVQVAVVGADHPVFTASALIQIAGRVGRASEFPDGDVIYFHNGKTLQMDQARREIKGYNRQGGE